MFTRQMALGEKNTPSAGWPFPVPPPRPRPRASSLMKICNGHGLKNGLDTHENGDLMVISSTKIVISWGFNGDSMDYNGDLIRIQWGYNGNILNLTVCELEHHHL